MTVQYLSGNEMLIADLLPRAFPDNKKIADDRDTKEIVHTVDLYLPFLSKVATNERLYASR